MLCKPAAAAITFAHLIEPHRVHQQGQVQAGYTDIGNCCKVQYGCKTICQVLVATCCHQLLLLVEALTLPWEVCCLAPAQQLRQLHRECS